MPAAEFQPSASERGKAEQQGCRGQVQGAQAGDEASEPRPVPAGTVRGKIRQFRRQFSGQFAHREQKLRDGTETGRGIARQHSHDQQGKRAGDVAPRLADVGTGIPAGFRRFDSRQHPEKQCSGAADVRGGTAGDPQVHLIDRRLETGQFEAGIADEQRMRGNIAVRQQPGIQRRNGFRQRQRGGDGFGGSEKAEVAVGFQRLCFRKIQYHI